MEYAARRLSALLATSLVSGGLLLSPAGAEQDLPIPAPRSGDVLRMPGMPPVDLPPGAKIFGPSGPEMGGSPRSRPSARGETPPSESGRARPDAEQAGAAKPSPPLSQEAQRRQVLDELFKQLAGASSPDDSKAIAGAIQRVWDRSGSDTADLLTGRAMTAASAGQTALALELLDHVVEIAPTWAEGWNKRATVRFLSNDYDGSMADIDRTLLLEPRHFGSLGGLATILQRSGLDKSALEVLRRVVTLYPQQPDIQKLIDRLSLKVDGRDI